MGVSPARCQDHPGFLFNPLIQALMDPNEPSILDDSPDTWSQLSSFIQSDSTGNTYSVVDTSSSSPYKRLSNPYSDIPRMINDAAFVKHNELPIAVQNADWYRNNMGILDLETGRLVPLKQHYDIAIHAHDKTVAQRYFPYMIYYEHRTLESNPSSEPMSSPSSYYFTPRLWDFLRTFVDPALAEGILELVYQNISTLKHENPVDRISSARMDGLPGMFLFDETNQMHLWFEISSATYQHTDMELPLFCIQEFTNHYKVHPAQSFLFQKESYCCILSEVNDVFRAAGVPMDVFNYKNILDNLVNISDSNRKAFDSIGQGIKNVIRDSRNKNSFYSDLFGTMIRLSDCRLPDLWMLPFFNGYSIAVGFPSYEDGKTPKYDIELFCNDLYSSHVSITGNEQLYSFIETIRGLPRVTPDLTPSS